MRPSFLSAALVLCLAGCAPGPNSGTQARGGPWNESDACNFEAKDGGWRYFATVFKEYHEYQQPRDGRVFNVRAVNPRAQVYVAYDASDTTTRTGIAAKWPVRSATTAIGRAYAEGAFPMPATGVYFQTTPFLERAGGTQFAGVVVTLPEDATYEDAVSYTHLTLPTNREV